MSTGEEGLQDDSVVNGGPSTLYTTSDIPSVEPSFLTTRQKTRLNDDVTSGLRRLKKIFCLTSITIRVKETSISLGLIILGNPFVSFVLSSVW